MGSCHSENRPIHYWIVLFTTYFKNLSLSQDQKIQLYFLPIVLEAALDLFFVHAVK